MKKTLKTFIEYSSIDAKLIRAVTRQFGGWQFISTSAPDVAKYGIAGGFSGWIYYTETCKFYAKNQPLIVELIERQADEYGISPIDFVAGFCCLDADDKQNIGKTLYGNKQQHDKMVANALAWFAAEEVARSFVDWSEGE